MNFLEAFEELNVLNEDILTEKKWVTIKPNKYDANGNIVENEGYYYKFLTVDDAKKWEADITYMLSKHTGTYKQMLYKDALASLIADLNLAKAHTKADSISDPRNYIVQPYDETKCNENNTKILTRGDRFLRSSAHKTLKDILAQNTELDTRLKDALSGAKYIIHHINGDEAKTTLDNVVLIPYSQENKDTLKIANGIHGVLHGTENQISTNSALTKNISLFYFDENKNLKRGKCVITITL